MGMSQLSREGQGGGGVEEEGGREGGGERALTSPQVCMTEAMREMRSAACWRTLAALLLSLQRMVPQI